MEPQDINLWRDHEHVDRYLEEANTIPHRGEGEDVLLELLPDSVERVLDLGTGDGRLLRLIKSNRPECTGVGIDFSQAMLDAAIANFSNDPDIEILKHDLDDPLPDLGEFDLIVSSFAIHHVVDDRKRALYSEVFDRLSPDGLFCNLEHVASSTDKLHLDFLIALGRKPDEDDPSNKLAPIELQLEWLRDIGFVDVECFWKWRELALLAGYKPAT